MALPIAPETAPPPDPEGTGRLVRSIRRLSLKARLMFAFIVLILSSAFCTMLIGNAVLGRKIFELARSKADVDLGTSWQIWEGKIVNMGHVFGVISQLGYDRSPMANEQILRSLKDRGLFDFVGIVDSGGAIVAHSPPLARMGPVPASFEIVKAARDGSRPLASAVVVSKEEVTREAPLLSDRLKAFPYLTEALLLMAAAPFKNEQGEVTGLLYGGTLVNGTPDLVNQMIEAAVSTRRCEDPPCSAATVFQHDVRISTSHPEARRKDGYTIPLLSRADPNVSDLVLKQGRTYVGLANVVGRKYYTAYAPIQNFAGEAIGMLGIGTTEDEYREAQSKTALLFSSLIAAGMVFGFIMTYVFSVWLVRPIAQLSEGMNRVAEGNLNYKVHIEPDELRRLARAFNTMVKAVKDRDLKLREMTENRLSEVEKQISIGRLAAGVAHEINNPLTAVLSLSSLMLRHLANDDPRREDVEIIVSETTRCREIVSALLDFAREKPSTKEVLDLNQVLRDTIGLANKYHSLQRVRVDSKLTDRPLRVLGDPTQLQQVFTNLILNAAEATEGKPDGNVSILVGEDVSGDFVQVRVKDNGKGIPHEHINRIFEPFFTTKGKSKGTGLGLSVSLGIVQKHNGTIDVASQEGKGTTVTVTLPILAEENGGPPTA